MTFKLCSYWRSTTSFRVRAVLNLKGIEYQQVPINLVKGAQNDPDFREINPSKGVPVLILPDGTSLSQSHAIIQFLEDLQPEPPVFAKDPVQRAQETAAALCIATDIHPVNNLRVLRYLKTEMGQSDQDISAYVNHWMYQGLDAFQKAIRADTDFAFGSSVRLADIYLSGQMINARRWGLDLTPFRRLCEIDKRTTAIPEIAAAMPNQQPDCTK